MLEGAVRYCPQHAGMLAAQWSTQTRAWLECSPGAWRAQVVQDGTAQGDTGSTPAFCRAMRIVPEVLEL